jgi:peroxiredoxin
MNKFVLWVCCFVSVSVCGQAIILKDVKGKPFALNEKVKGEARVYYFLSPECPLCQSYSLTIRNLYKEFSNRPIEMIGIIPGTDFSTVTISEYEVKYKIPMKLLRDEQLTLVKKYNATITPEVVVIDAAGIVKYQGRIDNWAYELGKKRKVITEHNLRDALHSLLNHQPVRVTKTKAVGCYIE